jgi:co-chaperonin GroES (HSP10)
MGAITVPTAQDCYCEAEIIAVGPGVSRAGGARSDTFDLKVGMVVFVRYRRLANPQMKIYSDTGIPVIVDGEKYYLIEESDLGAILYDSLFAMEADAENFAAIN